jgi:hypothetical protein
VKAEVIATLPAVTVYLRALWNYLLYPNARTLPTWCRDPQRCPLKHKLVFVLPPNKPVRAGFKHVEV